jgi:IS1 family transposase
MNVLPLETRVRIVAALMEGNSIRSTERLVGCTRNAVMRFNVTAGEACSRLHDAMVRDVQAAVIQADELWTFVQKKKRQLTAADPAEHGDAWVYVAMDSTTKLILSYRVGKRNADVTQDFIADLRARVVGKPQLTTDGLAFYREAVERAFGPGIDFAQVVKTYETPHSPEAARRYSPGRIIREEKMPVTGRPEWSRISTSHIERSNLSFRMSLRRFTRLTNGFSKKLRNLEAAVSLWIAYYNLARVHETLRVTPAMAAGLTDHAWSIGELLDAALNLGPVPPLLRPSPTDPEQLPLGLSAKQANLSDYTLRKRRRRRIADGEAA